MNEQRSAAATTGVCSCKRCLLPDPRGCPSPASVDRTGAVWRPERAHLDGRRADHAAALSVLGRGVLGLAGRGTLSARVNRTLRAWEDSGVVVKQREWYVSATIALLTVISAVVVSSATLAAWWLWGPQETLYVPIRPEQHSAVVQSDGTLLMKREFEIRRPVEISITRELVRHDGDDRAVYRVALPPSTAQYLRPGEYKLERTVPLPEGIRPGVYELHNVARWQSNPLRETVVELPVIRVVVP